MEPHADEAGAGADTTAQDRNEPKYADYIKFKTLPPGGPLNRWSHAVTREHDFPGAQVRSSSSLVRRCPRPEPAAKTRRKPVHPLGASEQLRVAGWPGNHGPKELC